ncbi:hypothetical protein D3C87_1404620 [compost metagenome]
MPGVVDVHRVDQQEVRRVAQAQVFSVGEQVRIRVVIVPVEMPVLDRQLRVIGVTIPGRDEGRTVVQLTDPVIGRRRGDKTCVGGVVIDAALIGQARDVVVDDTAVDGRDAGQDAFVQRAGQGWQLALQFVECGTSGADVSLQVPHGVAGDLVVEAVEHDKDDVVLHRGKNSVKQMIQVHNQSLVGAGLLANAVVHSTLKLTDTPPSRASPLPHLDRHQIPKRGSTRLLHIDDDFFLPLLRKGL